MQLNGKIQTLSKEFRIFIAVFVVVLSIGFFMGLLFVGKTSSANPQGIEEQYLGNEEDVEATVMKFKKSENEMLTLIHNHVLSMSLIFFITGALLGMCKLKKGFKSFLMIEPFVSIILTFGGLYFLWSGMLWVKYIVMLSGIVMTLTYLLQVIIILQQTAFLKKAD